MAVRVEGGVDEAREDAGGVGDLLFDAAAEPDERGKEGVLRVEPCAEHGR